MSHAHRTLSTRRPQLLALLVDDSGSMRGDKASKATAALRELVSQLTSGNELVDGQERSTVRFVTIRFSSGVALWPPAGPARITELSLDDDALTVTGDGQTRLDLALVGLKDILLKEQALVRKAAPEDRAKWPAPIVVLLSDGYPTTADGELSDDVYERCKELFADIRTIGLDPEDPSGTHPSILAVDLADEGLAAKEPPPSAGLLERMRAKLFRKPAQDQPPNPADHSAVNRAFLQDVSDGVYVHIHARELANLVASISTSIGADAKAILTFFHKARMGAESDDDEHP